MKARINGKLYDTTTARQLAAWDNKCLPGDFAYAEETLYRKRTGEYFLYGHGGPMTIYAEHKEDDSIGFGSRIKPLTEEQARDWAQRRKIGVEAYLDIFGDATAHELQTQKTIAEMMNGIATNHRMTLDECIACLGGEIINDMNDPRWSDDGDNVIINGCRYWYEDFEKEFYGN